MPEEEPLENPGYLGKPKGMRQLMWERGMRQDGMTGPVLTNVISQLPDFLNEGSVLSTCWTEVGHGTLETIKCHPETVTQELVWGCSKREFRNHINTKSCARNVLFRNVRKSLNSEPYINRRGKQRPGPITVKKIRCMGRHTRDLIRAYRCFLTPGELKAAADRDNCTSYDLIKKFAAKRKTHRCSGEQEYGIISTIQIIQ